jgi:hypothetical protein
VRVWMRGRTVGNNLPRTGPGDARLRPAQLPSSAVFRPAAGRFEHAADRNHPLLHGPGAHASSQPLRVDGSLPVA